MFSSEFYARLAGGEFDYKMNWLTQHNKKCVMMSSADLIARWFFFFNLKSFFKQPLQKCLKTVTLQANQKQNNSFIQSHGLLITCDNFFAFESFWRSSSEYVNVLEKYPSILILRHGGEEYEAARAKKGLSGTSRHLIATSGFCIFLVALFEDLINSSP